MIKSAIIIFVVVAFSLITDLHFRNDCVKKFRKDIERLDDQQERIMDFLKPVRNNQKVFALDIKESRDREDALFRAIQAVQYESDVLTTVIREEISKPEKGPV